MSMNLRLVRQRGSPFWYADFLAWDAAAGAWRRRFQSTKCTDKERAAEFALKQANIAQAIGMAARGGSWSQDKALEFVNELLGLAGLPTVAAVPSWADYSREWMTLKAGLVKEASLDAYKIRKGAFDDWLGPRAASPLSSITAGQLQAFYNHLLTTGRSPVTAGVMLDMVGAILERGRNEGHIRLNPVRLVERSSDARNKLSRSVFTVAELGKLLAAARKWKRTGQEWETMILLGVCTGARIQDCARLGRSHLQRYPAGKDGELWTLRFQPRKTERLGTMVEVPVVEPLRARMADVMKQGDGLLFCPSLAQSGRSLSNVFARIVAASKIEQRVMMNAVTGRQVRAKTFHSLRHTLPSLLQAAGVDQETRMRIVGHSSKAVHARYTHVEITALETALKRGLAAVAG